MDYEEKYEQALEKAKNCLKDGTITNTAKNYIEYIFPELKESEDEIRKEIISALKNANYKGVYDKHLAWLEKQQGEQKEYTFKSLPRLLDMIEPTSRAKAYCQKLIDTLAKEGYATDAKIVGECLKKMNGEDVPLAIMDEKQGEQKSIDDLTQQEAMYIAVAKCFDEQKPTCSEEGEEILNLTNLVIARLRSHPNIEFEEYKKEYNWLKSIRPLNTWKPSDGQIMALRWVLNHIPYDSHKEEISGLLEQLKKLKG